MCHPDGVRRYLYRKEMEKQQLEVLFDTVEEQRRLQHEANQRRQQEEEHQKQIVYLEEQGQCAEELQKLRKVAWLRLLQGRWRQHTEAWDDVCIAVLRSGLRYRGTLDPENAALLQKLEREKEQRGKRNNIGCWWVPFRKTKENILT